MRQKAGGEMRKFTLLIMSLMLIFTIGMVTFFTLDGIRRIDREEKEARQNVIDQFTRYFEDAAEATINLSTNSTVTESLNIELLEDISDGDFTGLLRFAAAVLRAAYNAEYYAFIVDGEPLAAEVRNGVNITDYPASIPEEGCEVLDELAGREGAFISIFIAMDIPGLGQDQFSNFVIDRTEEMQALSDIYDQERRSLIINMIIAGAIALCIAILLSTVILRYLTLRYIVSPLEDFIHTAQERMEGNNEGK